MKKWILIIILTVFYQNGNCQHGDLLIKVTDRLYMITGHGGNVSFLITDKGVLVVDAGTLQMDGKAIENHIKTVTEKPISYVVLTHYHFDHAFGVCGFSGNPIIVGYENVVKNLKTYGQRYIDRYRNDDLGPKVQFLKAKLDSLKRINSPEWREVEKRYTTHSAQLENLEKTKILLPTITFNKGMTIFLAEDTIRLVYPGNTHTDCNILVEFVNQEALATGDFLFNRCMPYIDYKANCDTKNWIEQIDYLAKRDFKYIIPGHGKLANKSDLVSQANYLSDLRYEINNGIKNKKTLPQLQSEIKMTKYSDYDFQYMLLSEIEAIYNELTK